MWIVTETHKQQNLGIFTLNLSFPLAKRFPVLVLHTWIAIHVVFTAKVILPGSGTKPGQGHRGILVVGFWVFLHLALSEKLSKSSPQWIWVLLYFWGLSYIRNQVVWSLRLCWWRCQISLRAPDHSPSVSCYHFALRNKESEIKSQRGYVKGEHIPTFLAKVHSLLEKTERCLSPGSESPLCTAKVWGMERYLLCAEYSTYALGRGNKTDKKI